MAARVGDLGQPGHDIEGGQRPRGGQQIGGPRRHPAADVVEQLVLEPAPPLLGPEHLGLVLLQLGRHVALGTGQRLAPHVLGGSARRLRVRHLDPVAEDAIEPHAQARQSRPCALALLEAGDPAPRLGRVVDQCRQRLAPRLANDPAVLQRQRWLIDQRGLQHGLQVVELGQRRARLGQQRRGQRGGGLANRGERAEAGAQPHEIAGVGDAERGPAGQAREIAHRLEQPAQPGANLGARRPARRPRPGGRRSTPDRAAAAAATGAAGARPSA